MLTELTLENYRAHERTRILLAPLTVLVGPNGVGKTSALEAVRYLSRMPHMVPERAFDGRAQDGWTVRAGATEPMKLGCKGAAGDRSWSLYVTVTEHDFEGATEEGTPAPTAADLLPATFLRLDAARLAAPSRSVEETPTLDKDGYGLATVLSTLKLSSTESFHAIEEAARSVIPRLRGLSFKRRKATEERPRVLTVEGQRVTVKDSEIVIEDELLLDFDDVKGLPARHASEGTLMVLGILAAIHGPSPSKLLLLDDLERALHPQAQRDLVGLLRKVVDRIPEVQILATCHSPDLVDGLDPEQVVVLGRRADGVVAAKRLADHPQAKLLDALTTGELWSAEGEDWVASV